jgi:hypothetical protein
MARFDRIFTSKALVTTAAVLLGSIAAHAQVLGPAPQSGRGEVSSTAPAQISPAQVSATPFDARSALAALQMRPVGEVVRKKHHIETEAAMSDGRRVIVSFDLAGRLWEIEHAEHDKHRYGEGAVNGASAAEAVRAAGFTHSSVREVKRNHTVVGAMTQKNEPVELHVDRGGVIYKQVWVR